MTSNQVLVAVQISVLALYLHRAMPVHMNEMITYHKFRCERIVSGGTGGEADAGEEVLRSVLHVQPGSH
jgi:hypothetical protein